MIINTLIKTDSCKMFLDTQKGGFLKVNTVKILNGEICLSFGSFGYKEVLDDFKNASYINIVTYNISKKNELLLNRLKEVKNDVEVNFITNIPNRHNTYYDSPYRRPSKTALETIESYCSKLDPKNFNCHMSVYFNFNNHTKIIMTNNIAYIGSQNFSDESSKSYETGILIRGANEVEKINKEIVAEIIKSSTLYGTSAYSIFKEEITYWLDECKRIVENFEESLFTYAEVGYYQEERVLDYQYANVNLQDWQDIFGVYEEVFSLIDCLGDDYVEFTNKDIIDGYIDELKGKIKLIEDELDELAHFNLDVMEIAQEHELYHTGESDDLEAALTYAQNKKHEKHTEIVDKIAPKSAQITEALKEIPSLSNKLIHILKEEKAYSNGDSINNTGNISNKIKGRNS
ncbi:hypothetical protein COL77_26045 [Bacillus wiedmannii]|nr:hypothetical protein COL77_26045 [Bacillus wiedmannii]